MASRAKVESMTENADRSKDVAGQAAAQMIESGMKVGLGSGSTFLRFLVHLATRVREEGLDIVGVPTSEGTAARARELGVALTTLEEVETLDIDVDGADEVDPGKNMIKGGGAALCREKIVAAASREMVVLVGENKMVPVLGKAFLLPVEVMTFGWRQAAARLAALGCETRIRMTDDQPLVTDNHNFIVDCAFPDGIADPAGMEQTINTIPGVLDNGLFVGMAGRILVGNDRGEVRLIS